MHKTLRTLHAKWLDTFCSFSRSNDWQYIIFDRNQNEIYIGNLEMKLNIKYEKCKNNTNKFNFYLSKIYEILAYE